MKPKFCAARNVSSQISSYSIIRILFNLLCLSVILLTSCASLVVYRINPDAIPKMGAQEAQEAVELTLTLRKTNPQIVSVSFKGDQLEAMISEKYRSREFVFTYGYSNIKWEIVKSADLYVVPVQHSGSAYIYYNMMLLTWKSENDARLFLDAMHSLHHWKIMKDKDETAVASAQAPLLKKEIPPQLPEQKEKAAQVKSPVPDIALAKPAPTVLPAKELPEAPKPAVSKKTPPKITITSPDISRTVSVAPKVTSINITGQVESKSGVVDVLVNGEQAELDEQGRFLSVVPLKIGQNTITVTATDILKNKTTKQLAVYREAGKAAVLKAEAAPPKITITSPDITRAVSLVAKKIDITIIGIAESKNGIMDVSVNGQDAELDEKGNFSSVVPLKIGQNTITVEAVDVLKNKSTKQFIINREAGKVTAVKKQQTPIEAELTSAKYYALLIAVEDYDSREISKLDYAISDARSLGDILVSLYTFERDNVITITNPDRRTIYKTLQSLRSKLTDKDNLLIFYAGHGYWLEDMKQGFWLPRDASGINDPSDWISNSTVRDYIKAIKARHILVVADSCFSGGIFKTRKAFSEQNISVEKIYELSSRKAITSGSMKTVPDRSVFIEYLVKRLKTNKESYLDTQKLFASLRDAVINNSPTHQTPLYGSISEAGDEGGDFVFVRRE